MLASLFQTPDSTPFLNACSLALSIVAAIVSIVALSVSKAQVVNTTITNKRIKWIEDVRALLNEFIAIYTNNDEAEKLKKKTLASHIRLFLRDNAPQYKSFIIILKKCEENDFNQGNLDSLINEAQRMFNDVWVRMKREAGISKLSEDFLLFRMRIEKSRKDHTSEAQR